MVYPSPSLTDDLSVPPSEEVSWDGSWNLGNIDPFYWPLPEVFSPTQPKEPPSHPRISESERSSRRCSFSYERDDAQSQIPRCIMSIDSSRPRPSASRKASTLGNTLPSQNGKGDSDPSNRVRSMNSSTEGKQMFDIPGRSHTERSSTWRTADDPKNSAQTSALEFKCKFPKCERHLFNKSSELRNHIDTHHKCSLPGCEQSDLFTAKGQLDRHKRSVHGAGPAKLFYCDKPGCERGRSGRGFARKDHLLQHSRSHCDRRQRSSHDQVRAMPELEVPNVLANFSGDVVASRKRGQPASGDFSVFSDSEREARPKKHASNAHALALENKELTAEVARLKVVIAGLAGALSQLSKE